MKSRGTNAVQRATLRDGEWVGRVGQEGDGWGRRGGRVSGLGGWDRRVMGGEGGMESEWVGWKEGIGESVGEVAV